MTKLYIGSLLLAVAIFPVLTKSCSIPGLVADIDIESEKYRWMGSARLDFYVSSSRVYRIYYAVRSFIMELFRSNIKICFHISILISYLVINVFKAQLNYLSYESGLFTAR